MDIIISEHAKERIKRYNLTEKIVTETIRNHDEIVKGYAETSIAHKSLNEHILRVVYAKEKEKIKLLHFIQPKKKDTTKNESNI